MDWIHCNKCFKQPRQSAPGRKFFLTSCGHIYCGTCLNSKPAGEEKCIVCASTYTVVHLNEEMKPEVQEYFKDVQNSLKKLSEVMVFQNGHRQRLATHSKIVDDKYAAAKDEVKRMYELDKSNKTRIKELENALKFYKTKIDNLQAVAARPRAVTPSNDGPRVHKPTQSPILSGSSTNFFTQKILQTSQGIQKSGERMWLTPNRLALQYKLLPTTPVSVKPSPDSSVTPTQLGLSVNNFGKYFGSYRKNNSQYSSQTTPGKASPAVPIHSSNTPTSAQYYRQSGGLKMQHNNNYYDSSVPVGSTFNLGTLNLTTQRSRNEPQNKK